MPPSSRKRAAGAQQRQTRPTPIFRVTKSSTLNAQASPSKQKLNAVKEAITEKFQPQTKTTSSASSRTKNTAPTVNNIKKRRHDALDSDNEDELRAGVTRPQIPVKKVRPIGTAVVMAAATSTETEANNDTQTKLRQTQLEPQLQLQQPLTPPASSPDTEALTTSTLPTALEELKSLHKVFLQALAVHYAHNGVRNAVSLGAIMPSMTRLWKRRCVRLNDVERMLAVWEEVVQTQTQTQAGSGKRAVEQSKGPFRLISVGVGSFAQTQVEYAWATTARTAGAFMENELQARYEEAVEQLFQRAESEREQDSGLEYIYDTNLTFFPRLKCTIGTQTAARKEKVASIKAQILSKPTSSPIQTQTQSQPQTQAKPQFQPQLDLSNLNISDSSDRNSTFTTTNRPQPTSREEKLKSRTLSLFDRLKAKQALTSTSITTSQPLTAQGHLRRRALHLLPTLLPLLRLKQSQKLSSLLRPNLNGLQSGTRLGAMKVSFSMDALVREIVDSRQVNLGCVAGEEVRCALEILGEMEGNWCKVFASGSVKCVTLQGEMGFERVVREWCKEELRKMEGQ